MIAMHEVVVTVIMIAGFIFLYYSNKRGFEKLLLSITTQTWELMCKIDNINAEIEERIKTGGVNE